MFAGTTTIRAHPSYIDAGIKHVRDIVMPVLADIEGCLGLSLLIDRGSGRCIVTSSWRDEASLRASEGLIRMLRDEGARMFHGATEVARWEIVALHRDHRTRRGACCRVTWIQVEPTQADCVVHMWKTTSLPKVEELDGFCSVGLMLDRATGRGVASLTFDSAEAMDSNRERVDSIHTEMARGVGARLVDTGEFELAIAHLHVPEIA
ncbi:antibiotic biosynthesis monooxygenase [Rhodococcus sp. NPDC047139]|jgi:quinol monooxygenase YgiN|uniref:antibiotic biosynthesis monooxygenase n=1 Tax=Rhodococcus sp. NPDC047139 TaxID=3155141 RepID=UPI00340995F4